MNIRIHPTAEVSPGAVLGEGTTVWHQAQIREGAHLGVHCIVGKGVYIDAGVSIGDNVKIQNYSSIYHGVTIEDGVFIGPHVVFTNDLHPRAINPDGSIKSESDWVLSKTLIHRGAALGASSIIVCGHAIGAWAMTGAGSVVTSDLPEYALAYGNPARVHGFVCPCGYRLKEKCRKEETVIGECSHCGRKIPIPVADWEASL